MRWKDGWMKERIVEEWRGGVERLTDGVKRLMGGVAKARVMQVEGGEMEG